MKQLIIDLDAPVHPGAVPDLGLGDLVRYAPIIEEVIHAVQTALTTGSAQIPAIKIHSHGKGVTLGPCPAKLDL